MNSVSEQMVPNPMSGSALPFTASAVSWGAIVAGAAGAAALSLILLILGTGLGLSAISPWAFDGVSAAALGISTILWVTFTQLLASGMGGYLAGRLRTKWLDTQSDEVYFRDTAHGFLSWAIASLATAVLLSSAIGSIIGTGIKAGASVAGGAASVAMTATAGAAATAGSSLTKSGGEDGQVGYFIDSLFRSTPNNTSGETPAAKPGTTNAVASGSAEKSTASAPVEVTRIFLSGAQSDVLPADDVRYVGQLIAQRTGLTQQEAEQRVTDTYARMKAKIKDAELAARDAADKGRKASAYAALWLFVSLLVGAFVASAAATFGGRQRDM